MKTFVKIFASLTVILAAASCQQFEIDTQMTPEKAAASLRLVCDAVDSYTLPATNPGTVTFNVSANTPWTITRSSGADWCTVTPSSSASSTLISDVVVSVEPNTLEEDRSATLTVKGENINKVYTITIKQARSGKLFITPVPKDFAACGGPLSFTILTNQDWEVRSNVSWLSFNRESGIPDPEGRTITIIATAEPSDVMERTATVTVVAGDDEESFDVAQTGTFELTELSDSFAAEGGEQVLKLRTDLPWTISADKNWLSFDQEEGTGDGSAIAIKATASANEGAMRSATVTVKAGGTTKEFEVGQKGLSFEIVAPASTELPREGGEMLIEVNSSLDWAPETEVDGWTVEKVDASHFKVVAAFNNKFAAKSGKVAIVSGANRAEVELTQAINFAFEGHYEILDDGSVKLYCDVKTRVKLMDTQRYASFVLKMGEVSFDDNGQLCLYTHDANGEYEAQIMLSGNKRLRTNGGGTSYNTKSISIDKAMLNALTEYRMDFRPNAGDPAQIDLEFFYNGSSLAQMTSTSSFAADAATRGNYYFGVRDTVASETWYVVKSCDVTVVEE
ncbi:MAG: BACON domain-containing protein [Bacteroidales bacterium]|nr:BACON domain-containing protein [Bacteroidales bacterium]